MAKMLKTTTKATKPTGKMGTMSSPQAKIPEKGLYKREMKKLSYTTKKK